MAINGYYSFWAINSWHSQNYVKLNIFGPTDLPNNKGVAIDYLAMDDDVPTLLFNSMQYVGIGVDVEGTASDVDERNP